MRPFIFFLIVLYVALPAIVQAQTPRVTAVTNICYDASTLEFVPQDSTTYVYSGMRGGFLMPDLTAGWQYSGKQDTSTRYVYSRATLQYYPNDRTIQSFDAKNNLLMQTVMTADLTGVITNKYLYTYTYDTGNNQLSELAQNWNTTGTPHWENYSHTIYTYSASGDPVTDTTFNWSTTNSTWTAVWFNIYAYDTHHNLISKLTYAWRTISSTWVMYGRTTYYLNAITNKTDSILKEAYLFTVYHWQGLNKYKYTYDGSGNMLSDTTYQWNNSLTAPGFVLQWLNTYNYSGTDMTSQTVLTRDTASMVWNDSTYYTYLYDANHNLINRITALWTGTAYVNSTKDSNIYNSHNNPTNYRSYNWNSSISVWYLVNGSANHHYYYEPYAAVANATAPTFNLALYPNPAADVLNIGFKCDVAQNATITIYDMNGRPVRQWQTEKTNNYHGQISVSGLNAGSYLISIQAAGETINKQFTVVH